MGGVCIHIYTYIYSIYKYIYGINFFLVFSNLLGKPVILPLLVLDPTSCSPPGTHLGGCTPK